MAEVVVVVVGEKKEKSTAGLRSAIYMAAAATQPDDSHKGAGHSPSLGRITCGPWQEQTGAVGSPDGAGAE